MIKAVLFDFDGLILDTETTLYEAWRETYEVHGLTLELERWGVNVGGHSYEAFHPLDHLARHIGEGFDRAGVDRLRQERYLTAVWSQDALPGAGSLMEAVKAAGLALGVASSSSREWVQGHLERLGFWRHVDAGAFGDEVAAVKPDPEIYRKVLGQLGVGAHEALTLEDSPKGVAAAKAAGIYCVAVPNPVTAVLDLSPADFAMASLASEPLEGLVARAVEARRQAGAKFEI